MYCELGPARDCIYCVSTCVLLLVCMNMYVLCTLCMSRGAQWSRGRESPNKGGNPAFGGLAAIYNILQGSMHRRDQCLISGLIKGSEKKVKRSKGAISDQSGSTGGAFVDTHCVMRVL